MSPTPTTFHSRSLLKTIQMIMPAADARGRVDSRDASSLLRPLSNCPNRSRLQYQVTLLLIFTRYV